MHHSTFRSSWNFGPGVKFFPNSVPSDGFDRSLLQVTVIMLSSLRTNNKSGKSFENQHQDDVIIITTIIVSVSVVYSMNLAQYSFDPNRSKGFVQKAVFAQNNVFVFQ